MDFWIINIICGFGISAILAGVLIPQILLIAFRKQLFDEPGGRKIHHVPVPRLGGLAFTPVIFFTVAFLLGVNIYLGNSQFLFELSRNTMVLAFMLCSLTLLYLVGIADDLIGVRYRGKFLIQLLCGLFMVVSGIWMRSFYGFFSIDALHPLPGTLLTMVLVVFIINAINMIDGLDGLASGLSGVACLYYGITFMGLHLYTYALIAFVTLGVIVPFFIYNVFGKAVDQKKIFMGDTGALTIGIILAILSIKITTVPASGLQWSYHPLVVAFAPLMIPCLDVLRVFFHRIRNGRNPFLPDNNHIHHKMLACGFGPHLTMAIIIFIAMWISFVNLWISQYIEVHLLLLLNFLFYAIVNYWLTYRIKTLQKCK